MRFVWHQFKKDIMHLRGLLLMYGVLLSVDLINLQEWIGEPNYGDGQIHSSGATGGLGQILIVSVMVIVVLLTGAVVSADSPTRENAFVRTRPVPGMDIFIGKLLFIGVGVLAPALIVELLHLVLSDAPGWVVGAGLLNRAMFLFPIVGVVGAAAIVAPRFRSIGNFMLTAYLSWISGLLVVTGMMELMGTSAPDTSFFSWVGMFWVLAIGMGILAWKRDVILATRVRRIFSTLATAWLSVLFLFGSKEEGIIPSDHGRVEKMVQRSRPEIPIVGGLNFLQSETIVGDDSLVTASFYLSPVVRDLPANWNIEWSIMKGSLSTPDKKLIYKNRRANNHALHRNSMTGSDLRAFMSQMPEDVRLSPNQNHHLSGRSSTGVNFGLRDFSYFDDRECELVVDAVGTFYEWNRLGVMPLRKGEKLETGPGVWEIKETDLSGDTGAIHMVNMVMEYRGPFIFGSQSQGVRMGQPWPSSEYEFLLYDKKRKVILMLNGSNGPRNRLGAHTSFEKNRTQLSYSFPSVDLTHDDLEIYVFRRRMLGRINESFHLAVDTGNFRGRHNGSQSSGSVIKLSEVDFIERMTALPKPRPDASSTVVGNYLYEVLRLDGQLGYYRQEGDPLAHELAPYVEHHLDLILNAVERSGQRLLDLMLIQGLKEKQKEAFIAELTSSKWLTDVAVRRGWDMEATEGIKSLVGARGHLNKSALSLLFHEGSEESLNRVYDEFQAIHDDDLYELLITKPETASRVKDDAMKVPLFELEGG
ncbi:hypothetical protein N9B94_01010 [Verrucomicrobia bacterium]|nr:hypothetical protein [Verrucomicrobiota bacterium]